MIFHGDENYYSYPYYHTLNKYFSGTFESHVYVNLESASVDIYSEEAQLMQLRLEDALQRCENCQQKWFKPSSVDSWFSKLRTYVNEGSCWVGPQHIDPFKKTIDPKEFEDCSKEWFTDTNMGKGYKGKLIPNEDNDGLLGF